MALAKMTFDELNRLVGYKKSEPIDEYFGPMRISEEAKRRRERLAYELEQVFLGLLIEMFYADQYETPVDQADLVNRILAEYMAVIGAIDGVEPDEYLQQHAEETILTTLEVLFRHRDDPYYYSNDRARIIAEGESNAIWSYEELAEAFEDGYSMKTWNTIMDGRERDSHAELNGVTIPLDEPFEARGGLLMFPGDDSLDVSDEELVSCRCSLSFSK